LAGQSSIILHSTAYSLGYAVIGIGCLCKVW